MGYEPLRLNAVFLRGHCRLMAQGMTHSRLSKTKVLQMAGDITGKKYKRGQHQQAYEDLTQFLNDTQPILPVDDD